MSAVERVMRFGDDGRLCGIVTQPPADAPRRRTGVLLLNAGIIHKIGAHRLNVKLARRLSRLGFPALRFDLSGLGDSRPAKSSDGFEAQSVRDIGAAIECLVSEMPVDEVVAIGLCSGADNSLAAALHDPRIRGLVMLDAYAYPTRIAETLFLLRRAFEPGRLRRFVTRLLREARQPAPVSPEAAASGGTSRRAPAADWFESSLSSLAARGVSMLVVYTRQNARAINAPWQFGLRFPRLRGDRRIEVDVAGDANHTFTPLASQAWLGERIEGWLADRFGVAEPGAIRGPVTSLASGERSSG
jgi:pimeloyl-ACP methyl ester carboxylesterase